MTPESIAAITAATAIARDLTVGGVLIVIIGGWLRGIVKRAADADKELARAEAGHERAMTDLKAAHGEAMRAQREGFEALLAQVRSQLAESHEREDEWKVIGLRQHEAVQGAVDVARNSGRGGLHA